MTTITEVVTKSLIKRLFHGEDYRIEIVNLIDAQFLDFSINFFKRVVEAKLKHENINTDWYKEEFLNENLSSDELIINSGLNRKTISNMYNSASRGIVLEVTQDNYQRLYEVIQTLVDDNEIDLTLTIKFRSVSVDLNINESLIVINVLAVKRSQLRGGAWSSAGKQVEKKLMLTFCKLYGVSDDKFCLTGTTDMGREVDFYLVSQDNAKYRCEIKLMGIGNPESADAIIARASQVFITDKLSDLNKSQLNSLRTQWVEMRSKNGYCKFEQILLSLDVPYEGIQGEFERALEKAIDEAFLYN